jgi:TPR repeat protein
VTLNRIIKYHLYIIGGLVLKRMQKSTNIMRNKLQAAIGGHPIARYNLALWDGRNGNMERAVKHLIIAANLGDDESIESLKEFYAHGAVSKENFAAALRAHQAAVDATKSPQRDAAEAAKKQ